jgi:hypothetical protein
MKCGLGLGQVLRTKIYARSINAMRYIHVMTVFTSKTRKTCTALSLLVFASIAAAALAGAPAGASAPKAKPNPAKFEKAQVGLTYTVYAPSTSINLTSTSFQLVSCAVGKDDQINASYGSQMSNRGWISISEAQSSCEDGPDGVGPLTTFSVKGATATVMGSCKGGKSTCSQSNRTLLRKGQGYTTVTLPAGGAGLQPTFIEVYSANMSLQEIRTFVRGLQRVQ